MMKQSNPSHPVPANWNHLRTNHASISERFEAQQAGGGEWVKNKFIQTAGLQWSVAEDFLKLEILETAEESIFWETTPSAVEFPASWEGMSALELRTATEVPHLEIQLEIAGARNLLSTAWVPAGQTLSLPLIELPLTAGHRPPFEPSVVRIKIRTSGPKQSTATLRCLSLTLVPSDAPARQPVLDRFGQRLHSEWEGKVHNEVELREQLAVELSLFQQIDRSPYGRFGGWQVEKPLKATGFFRVDQVNGRWIFVDPEGLPFWSLGITGIRLAEYTPFLGREWLFSELPSTDGPESKAYMRRPLKEEGPLDCISFYHLNVLRKYGNAAAWKNHMLERLPAWGFNTGGNWSSELLDQNCLPYTRWLRTNDATAPLIAPRFPDVFNPEWEAWFDDLCAREVAPHQDDPWILGWFVDNELPWAKMNFAPPDENPGAFYKRYAETYFSKVSHILRKHAPRHLYLGCRFVRMPPAEYIVRIAGEFCDVVTVNCYALVPPPEQFNYWHKTTGRPILIGEHHLPLASQRQLPPLYQAFTAAEREKLYEEYLHSWAQMPFSLGAHWFQWVDQVGTGRGDGENQTIGFVDVTDQPHPGLLLALKAVRKRLHEWLGLTDLN